MTIAVRRAFGIAAGELAAASQSALEVPLAEEAELWIARPKEEAIALGSFQRALSAEGKGSAESVLLVRRGSGGPAVRMGEGTLWVALLLARVDALVPCDEARLVNRYVRPLLRALTKCGALAHFFGRDWVSVSRRPAAWIGFAHDRASGRAVVEAFIARETPFDAGPRASYLGKEPGTLRSILGHAIDEEKLVAAIVLAYAEASGHRTIDRGTFPLASPAPDVTRLDPPWGATVEEVIGPIGAGLDASGRFRVGGDLLVSRDALAALEALLPTTPDAAVAAALDATLAAPGVALDGVRSLTSIRDAILAARGC